MSTEGSTTSVAFRPLEAGALHLPNRVVMAPMTRSRAVNTLPTAETATYYAQRAGAGLIITEGTQPSIVGQGYPSTPGLHFPDHIAAWRSVTSAVHAEGGLIVAQLMHTGRIGHPDTVAESGHGALNPVAPSAVRARGQVMTPSGPQDHVVPTPLDESQIRGTILDFAHAARNALDAHFDGVEIHGANGYLLHQFLASNTNRRTDEWGGSVANRIRFTLGVTKAVASEIGAERTALRLSPGNGLGDTAEDDQHELYPQLVEQLDELGLAYLHLVEPADSGLSEDLRRQWSGSLILNPTTPNLGDHADRLGLIDSGSADAISFGRLFISNPDLATRLASGAPLTEPDLALAYGGDHRGYTDYPTLATPPATD